MEELQLDLNAPLLSVRRNAARTQPILKTVGNPGVVPFTWEQTPGKPKGGVLIRKDREKFEEEDVEDAIFTDAIDILSSSSSSSFSDASEHSESFLKDAEIRDLMMRRFLPAAKAMATGPLKSAPSTWSDGISEGRKPVPLPYQNRPKIVSRFAYNHGDGKDKEEEGYGGGSNFSRACGLIPQFCSKGSVLFLNPVPGMKVRSQLPVRSQIEVSDHESVGNSEDESWEAVYRYKIGLKENPVKDDESKMTSESNQLTYWSDSQTADETSYQHSPQSPLHDEKGFNGVPVRELKSSRKTISFDACEVVNGSYGKTKSSPDLTPLVVSDPLHMAETLSSKLSSADCERIEGYPVPDICQIDELKAKISDGDDDQRSNSEGINFNEEKNDTGLALSLLPLPLPRAPSESWLQRTLPSRSSKNQPEQSLLGIQVQHRKQFSWAPSSDFKRVSTKPALPRYKA